MISDLMKELREQAKKEGQPAESVKLIETHISWVLMGPHVYKIKKPVTLPFLDFSTFEARERACQTETRINRRLAPRVYQGVVPIRRRADGRFSFGATGSLAEWAVRMLRLDDSLRADALLARGALSRRHVDALATTLASFHGRAPNEPWIARFGAPALVEQHVVDNFASLRESNANGGFITDDELATLERWQIAFVRGRRELFDQRAARGFVREGHGDLRLEHVFFRPSKDDSLSFEVIDGIEFDDRYRFGDVCSDIAFLAMDLARLGHVELAERLIAVYARETNDFDLYHLIDFYESYRACVRAKISAALATEPNTEAALADAAAAETRRYLLLAQASRKKSVLAPALIAVAGGIAAGKSTLAERLAEEMSAPIVDADRTRKHLVGVAPTDSAASGLWAGAYDPHVTGRVYAEVLRRAGAVLASGRPVIIDASFRTAAKREAARELAHQHNVPFRLIECDAPLEVRRERLMARAKASNEGSASVSDATAEILDAFTASYEPITEIAATEHVHLDTSGSLEDTVKAAREAVLTWPRGLVQ